MASKASRSIHRNFHLTSLSTAIATALFGVGAVNAQDQQEALEEITITGSRIRNTSGFTTPVPVTSVTIDELSDFEPSNTISSQLDALPQFFQTRTLQDTGNPGPQRAASGLNLRALGGKRTLVLLDGHRLAPTDKDNLVNVDLLPSSLMRSVDVVTGGASAAYGADAVGGVVNFVLDREFEGLKASIGTGLHERGYGGESWQFEVAGGRGFFDDRLHLIGSVQSQEVSEITDNGKIDNFHRIGHVTNPEWVANGTGPRRLTLPNVVSTASSVNGLILAPGTPLHRKQFSLDGTDIIDFIEGDVVSLPGTRGSSQSMSGGPEAQSAYKAFGTSPDGAETISRSGFFGAKYDVNDRLSLRADAMVGRTEANMAENTQFELEGIWAATIFVDNAYLPEHVRQVMIDNGLDSITMSKLGSYPDRPAEGSTQVGHNVTTQWQYSTGFEYQIPGPDWLLSGHWQRGEATRLRGLTNRIRLDKLFLSMDAVRDPASDAIVCRVQLFNPTVEELQASVADRISSIPVNVYAPLEEEGNTKPLESPIGLDNVIRDCVPYNAMGSGNITPSAIDYISGQKTPRGIVDQDFAELSLTGDLFDLPAGPVSFAAGLTWRDQQFIDGADAGGGTGVGGKIVTTEDLGPPVNVPELGIQGIPSGYEGGSPNLSFFITVPYVGGQADVWEWYGEVNVPIFDAVVGSWEQRLSTNLAFRRSTYDRSGEFDSWKVGIDYQMHSDWRLRYTRSQDVREPTFAELFDRRGGGGNVRDPRFGGALTEIFTAQGGNRNLSAEEADTSTVGVVWQPTFSSWITGLQISLDWWDTEISGQVSQLSAQRYVDECENNGLLCDQVLRDPVTGVVTRILRQWVNLGSAAASGTDLEVSWRTEPDFFPNEFESFTLRWMGSHLEESSTTPAGGSKLDSAGELGTPDYTHVLTANYGIGSWSVQLQNRFVDSTLYEIGWVEGVDVDDNSISSMSWWNGRLSYQNELNNGSTWTASLNVQNVFDREPPIVPGFSTRGGTQQFHNQFDRWGRRYTLSLNYAF